MNSEIKMSVSSLIRTEDKKAVYVMFQDGEKSAELTLPDLSIVSNKGFSDKEIAQLKDYMDNEREKIYAMAKEINPLRAFMGR